MGVDSTQRLESRKHQLIEIVTEAAVATVVVDKNKAAPSDRVSRRNKD